jgi:hypothetical protein
MYIELNCTSIIYIACLLVVVFGDKPSKKIAAWIGGTVFVIQVLLAILALLLFATY